MIIVSYKQIFIGEHHWHVARDRLLYVGTLLLLLSLEGVWYRREWATLRLAAVFVWMLAVAASLRRFAAKHTRDIDVHRATVSSIVSPPSNANSMFAE